MTWRLLAPVTAEGSAGPVELAARPRGVLLALLTRPNEVVSTDRLAFALWGEEPPKSAANSIARFVADLRRALGDQGERVETRDGGYRLEVLPGELDVDEARAALRQAVVLIDEEENLDGALSTAIGGLGWFGSGENTALADLRDTGAVLRSHEELEISLRELAADLQIRRGAHQGAIAELEVMVGRFPYHERFWAQLMLALYRSGRQADALAAYQRLVDALVDIGLEPSPPVSRLEAEILGHSGSTLGDGGVADGLTARVAKAQFGLPEPRTSFVGREAELRDLAGALDEGRMVTIVGLGGCGKTRLALAMARTVEEEGGAVFRVGLAPMTDPALLLPAIAEVIGVPAGKATDVEMVAEQIGPQRFLLVLDNCEHLIAASAALVEALLDGAPQSRVLATSRRPLRVVGEQVFRLRPLDAPAPGGVSATHPAVSLFLERARSHQPDTASDGEALLEIGEICRVLGGLPIAIELAAAQMAHMAPAGCQQAVLECIAGDPAELERLAGENLELGTETGEPDAFEYFGAAFMSARWQQGREMEIIDQVRQVAADNPKVEVFAAVPANFLAEADERDEAAAMVRKQVAAGFDFPVNNNWTSALAVWALAAHNVGDAEAAGALYERLRPWAGQVVVNRGQAMRTIDGLLGMLATTTGDHETAEAHFAAAEALTDALGARYFAAYDDLARARLHRDRGAAGTEEARRYGERALASARDHGYGFVERAAGALLADLAS